MEWLLTSDWQYVVYGLGLMLIGWLARQAWSLLNQSIKAYKRSVEDRFVKIESAQEKLEEDLRAEIRSLENDSVQMVDEEERARKQEIARVEDRMTGMVQSVRADISNVRGDISGLNSKLDGIKDQMIEILRPS